MALIGMLHHRRDPRNVIKAYAFAAVAKAEGVDFCYFSPGRVNFTDRTILGQVYENGNWKEKVLPFPDVIYNCGSPMKLKKTRQTVKKLRREIPFTTHSVGLKMAVHKRLESAGVFSKYLIPSVIIKNSEQFFQFLKKYNSVVIKPYDGHKGEGIIYIKESSKGFITNNYGQSITYTAEEFNKFIQDLLDKKEHIIQPYIESRTKSGLAFDLRLHVQRNGQGKWVITKIYPRIAPPGSIVCNISRGGYTSVLEDFLEQEYGSRNNDIKRMLEDFALSLANHLGEIHKAKFNELLDELGIDIGLDKNDKIWLYEVNWRPGVPPYYDMELDVAKNTIHYALFLARQRKSTR